MILKTLKYEDFICYKEKIKDFLVYSYQSNFDISQEYSVVLCNEKLTLLEDYVKTQQCILIGALEDENLIGFIWAYKHIYFSELRLHVNQIVIDRNYQGRGIGKNLLSEIEKVTYELGINAIDLFVSENNLEAKKLYEKSGYVTERRYLIKRL